MTPSTLKARLAEAVKNAMRAKDSARLTTLRMLSAAIKQKEVDERIELDDAAVIAIVEKQVKQRRESATAFEQARREQLAAQERAEIIVLQDFLPSPATPEQIQAAVEAAMAVVATQDITGGPAMGRVMALLKQALAGRADMAEVSKTVKARLQ